MASVEWDKQRRVGTYVDNTGGFFNRELVTVVELTDTEGRTVGIGEKTAKGFGLLVEPVKLAAHVAKNVVTGRTLMSVIHTHMDTQHGDNVHSVKVGRLRGAEAQIEATTVISASIVSPFSITDIHLTPTRDGENTPVYHMGRMHGGTQVVRNSLSVMTVRPFMEVPPPPSEV